MLGRVGQGLRNLAEFWRENNSPAVEAARNEAAYAQYQRMIRSGAAIRLAPDHSDAELAQIGKDFEEMLAHPLARKYLKQTPELIIVDQDRLPLLQKMNAAVKCPRVVQVSSGLLEHLEADELKFIIGHELGHLIRGDMHPRNTTLTAFYAGKMSQRSERLADRLGVVLSGVGAEVAQRALTKAVTINREVLANEFSELPGFLRRPIIDGVTSESRTYPSLRNRLKLIARTAEDADKRPAWGNRVLQERLDEVHCKLR